ncbi:serine/threonine phosphatase [Aerosakkonema funiforme]|uniref:serine/threonine phosphatase n=1 Tax=Aerosakkonema funiforme TaxID=1246630 RepID=UPI0035BB9131
MLVCPQCHFENPDANKFCQQCGTSLTHKVCPECGSQVAYSAKVCQNCDTFTGTVWLGIISGNLEAPPLPSPHGGSTEIKAARGVKNDTSNLPSTTTVLDSEAASANSTEIQVWWDKDRSGQHQLENQAQTDSGDNTSQPGVRLLPESFLDAQQRYQLLESFTPIANGEMLIKVLDSQPLQESPLQVLLDRQSVEEKNLPISSASIASVPALAKAYVALQSQLYPALPRIQDAWIRNGQQIVLLEDRSAWPLLVDLWRDDQISQMHLLHLLHEMASIWVALESWHCLTTLVDLNNLRVDEDQSLGLLRLEQDPDNFSPTLEVLGQVWQQLFLESGRTLFGPLAMLMNDLKENTIPTIDMLRSRLQAIAEEFQGDTTEPTPMPPVDPSQNNLNFAPTYTPSASTKEHPTYYPGHPGDENETPTIVLPMQLLSLEDAGRTDVGRQRRHNEDYFGIRTSFVKAETPLGRNVLARGLYILCDGMGGHAGGEVASALAVKTLSQYFQDNWKEDLPDEDTIREAVLKANQAIYDVNQQDARSGSGRMGTTLVMVLVQETQVVVAHVGDSRLYRLSRRQGLEQVTTDHEVGQREIKRGVERSIAYSRPDSYQLTQALGPRNEHFVEPDIELFELNEDTLLLLCSDGLSDNDLIEAHWQTHLQPLLSSRASLEQGVNELIDLANNYNGHDNITAVLIRAKVRPDLEQARFGNS